MPQAVDFRIDEAIERCIQACLDCHHVCLETVRYCLLLEGRRAAGSTHVRTLLDGAELCQTTADFILSGSEFFERLCAICTDVLERCAEICDEFGEDGQLKACADACRRCAASCWSITAVSGNFPRASGRWGRLCTGSWPGRRRLARSRPGAPTHGSGRVVSRKDGGRWITLHYSSWRRVARSVWA